MDSDFMLARWKFSNDAYEFLSVFLILCEKRAVHYELCFRQEL